VTVNPRIAEAGGEIPLVVQRAGQPVKINVKIPPLTRNDTVFRLAGLGHFRPDKTRGDLYLTIKVPPYPEQNTDWADKW
jgi:DnaJ-class molecular chaperone